MNSLKNDKNPFANPDGSPIDGKEPEFFQWAREQELQRRKDLPADEVKALEESERALNKRMQS